MVVYIYELLASTKRSLSLTVKSFNDLFQRNTQIRRFQTSVPGVKREFSDGAE